MAKYRIMYWKHIPQSFTVEGDGRTVKKQLSQKVQNAIDAYAMATGLSSASDYSAQFKLGDWIERDGTPEDVAETDLGKVLFLTLRNCNFPIFTASCDIAEPCLTPLFNPKIHKNSAQSHMA